MTKRNALRLLVLVLLPLALAGCGKKGPPSLPQKPSSLLPIEQKTRLPGCFVLDWNEGGIIEDHGAFSRLYCSKNPLFHRFR
jgi:predicted small lipoprotein YifL